MAGATSVNLASVLQHQAASRPDRLALVCGGQRLTYGALDGLAGRVASALAASGVGSGDHVALSCPNVPYFPAIYYGALKAGAVVVPLNVLFKERELAYHLNDADAVSLFCFEGTADLPMARTAVAALKDAPRCRDFVVMPARPDTPPDVPGARAFSEFVASGAADTGMHPAGPDDTAVILYTSGTTGQPKGAELTHANLLLNAIYTRDLKLSELDTRADGRNVELVTLPLFHSFGQTAQMNAGFVAGATLVLVPRFDPKAVFELMVGEQVNFWSAVPTMYWALLQHVTTTGADPAPVAEHFRLGFSGGAPMPVELLEQFQRIFKVRILEGYGLSETSPVATFNQMSRPSKPGTVGSAIQAVEVRCVDEEGQPVPAGERGEVVIRGHNIMKGYYKRPAETAEALRGGWFHSGDIGVIDEDGYLSIVDRKKDMILRGGFNVYPREIEELLMTHPAVSLCAVLGVPDERLGEEVKAVIVVKPGCACAEEEVMAFCRERLAAYKCPRTVEFRASLPMTATGKILKRELREAAQA